MRDIRNLTPERERELKAIAENYFSKLESQLGRPITFDDVIRDRIERTSYGNVDGAYNGYSKMWELTGRIVDNSVYDKYFGPEYQIAESNKLYFEKKADAKYMYKEELLNDEPKNGDNFKRFNPFSYTGALYIGIVVIIVYILYKNVSITETGFIIIGILALFAFLYLEDNYKKK